MKILVVGSGGREHALVESLAASPSKPRVYVAPGNAGTIGPAENVAVQAEDVTRLARFAKEEAIDLVVVGPEAPLVAGLADRLAAQGTRVLGPSARAAALEGSKVFAKQLLRKHNVPTAEFKVFQDLASAEDYARTSDYYPLVVKADGLASGKGVFICRHEDEALAAIRACQTERRFGAAGERIVIEEFLSGQELSLFALTDGETILVLGAARDHKRVGDGDSGPNTGGMGAWSPVPEVSDKTIDDLSERIVLRTIHAMRAEGRPYQGFLYAGLMLTRTGPKVLEFNVRLGDPETQVLLPRLKSDAAELFLAAARGRLGEAPLPEWDERSAVCVVLASEGYPGPVKTGRPISGLEGAATLPDVRVFHAGTVRKDGQVLSAGGRVLGVTGLGRDLEEARNRAYEAVEKLSFQGEHYRSDIGMPRPR